MISARIPKGFRDSLPLDEFHRQSMIDTIRHTCFLMGYLPIDTPTLEYSEILLGKSGGETDKQVYSFVDPGGRNLSLRYDLTVPLARFVAQHMHELAFPFRRFHVGKVFRGENPQKGRYREFYQCDWDLIAEPSLLGDWEILHSIWAIFEQLGVENIHIHFSHRAVLPSLLGHLHVTENIAEIMRVIDKRTKIGMDACRHQLASYLETPQIEQMLSLLIAEGANADRLDQFHGILAAEQYDQIKAILDLSAESRLNTHLVFDPSITRGLDYYTGIVFETFLDDLPHIGSVCSGGRYDNLTSLYSKQAISGIGASIGLDRLIAGLTEQSKIHSPRLLRRVLICNEHDSHLSFYHSLLQELRTNTIASELFPDRKPIKKQFAYAEKATIPFVIRIADEQSISIKHIDSSASITTDQPSRLIQFIEQHASAI